MFKILFFLFYSAVVEMCKNTQSTSLDLFRNLTVWPRSFIFLTTSILYLINWIHSQFSVFIIFIYYKILLVTTEKEKQFRIEFIDYFPKPIQKPYTNRPDNLPPCGLPVATVLFLWDGTIHARNQPVSDAPACDKTRGVQSLVARRGVRCTKHAVIVCTRRPIPDPRAGENAGNLKHTNR